VNTLVAIVTRQFECVAMSLLVAEIVARSEHDLCVTFLRVFDDHHKW